MPKYYFKDKFYKIRKNKLMQRIRKNLKEKELNSKNKKKKKKNRILKISKKFSKK